MLMYCSGDACQNAVCISCIAGPHNGHILRELNEVLLERTELLQVKLHFLVDHEVAITKGINKIVKAPEVCDNSAASSDMTICSAALEQHAKVDGTQSRTSSIALK